MGTSNLNSTSEENEFEGEYSRSKSPILVDNCPTTPPRQVEELKPNSAQLQKRKIMEKCKNFLEARENKERSGEAEIRESSKEEKGIREKIKFFYKGDKQYVKIKHYNRHTANTPRGDIVSKSMKSSNKDNPEKKRGGNIGDRSGSSSLDESESGNICKSQQYSHSVGGTLALKNVLGPIVQNKVEKCPHKAEYGKLKSRPSFLIKESKSVLYLKKVKLKTNREKPRALSRLEERKEDGVQITKGQGVDNNNHNNNNSKNNNKNKNNNKKNRLNSKSPHTKSTGHIRGIGSRGNNVIKHRINSNKCSENSRESPIPPPHRTHIQGFISRERRTQELTQQFSSSGGSGSGGSKQGMEHSLGEVEVNTNPQSIGTLYPPPGKLAINIPRGSRNSGKLMSSSSSQSAKNISLQGVNSNSMEFTFGLGDHQGIPPFALHFGVNKQLNAPMSNSAYMVPTFGSTRSPQSTYYIYIYIYIEQRDMCVKEEEKVRKGGRRTKTGMKGGIKPHSQSPIRITRILTPEPAEHSARPKLNKALQMESPGENQKVPKLKTFSSPASSDKIKKIRVSNLFLKYIGVCHLCQKPFVLNEVLYCILYIYIYILY